jgi:tetratricopeptide (TPR) repeat protein
MRELADKMVAMDPKLPEGYIATGRAALVEMRWPEAEAAYRKALSLSPGNIDATVKLSGLMALMTRNDEAMELAHKAVALDPLDLPTLGNLESTYYLVGRCDEVERVGRRALTLAPGAGRFHYRIGSCLLSHNGDYAAAIEWFENEPVEIFKLTGLAIAYNKLGQQDKAQYFLDELIATNGETASYQYGQIYAQWGLTDKALDALEYAWDIHDTGVVRLKMDKFVDPIRDEPRFIALMEKWQDPAKR